MPEFVVTCRAVFDQGVIDELDRLGAYWFQGGPTLPESRRHRHHLKIEAGDPDKALSAARIAIAAAGGEADDLVVLIDEPFVAPSTFDR